MLSNQLEAEKRNFVNFTDYEFNIASIDTQDAS